MYNSRYTSVTEHKFMCPTHSEAKQTEMSEFGTEKGLLQDQARKMSGLCPQTPNSPVVFGEEFLKAKFGVKATGCVTFF